MLRSRFLWKLYGSFSAILLISGLAVGIAICQKVRADALEDVEESLRVRAVLVGPMALTALKEGAATPLSEDVNALGEETRTRLTVIEADGVVIADSDKNADEMENHFDRPELVAARAGNVGVATRFSETLEIRMTYVAVPVYDGGNIVGYVRAAASVESIDRRIAYVQRVVAMWVMAAVVASLVMAFLLAGHIVGPVASMTELAESMAGGDYDQRLPVSRKDELGQLGDALNRMAESCHKQLSELQLLERIRRDFVANASHELKTPITAIRGFVETMLEDPDMPETQRERFLSKARDQVERLSALVTDLLALSRQEVDIAERERTLVAMRRAVMACEEVMSPGAERRGIALRTEICKSRVMVMGEEDGIAAALINLVDNAIKYTPEGGRVELRLRSEGKDAVIEVQDTGIGIAPEHQGRIFERFYRVDKARSREVGGTGLGLAIVRRVVMSHGGTIQIESTPGEGSTFRITFPLALDQG
jgi:signal transduction histidine kinase